MIDKVCYTVRQTKTSGSMSNNVLASPSFSRRKWHRAPEWIKDDGLLSVRGRQFHQRWIHQAPAYVARFPLQAHLQGTAALSASLRYLVRALSPRPDCRAKKGIRAYCHLLRHLDQIDPVEFRAWILCVLRGAEMVEAIHSDTVARQGDASRGSLRHRKRRLQSDVAQGSDALSKSLADTRATFHKLGGEETISHSRSRR